MGASLEQLLAKGVPQLVKVANVQYTDMVVASPTKQIVVESLPAYGFIGGASIITTTTFEGGAIGQVEATIGTVASPSGYSNSPNDLMTLGGNSDLTISGIQSISSSTDIIIEITADANLNDLTQGECDVYLMLALLPQ